MATFKVVKCRIYKNDANKTEVFTTNIGAVNADGTQTCKVPYTQGLAPGNSYTFEAIHVSNDNLESEPALAVFTPSGASIQKPVITSPTLGTVLAKGANLTIEASAFVSEPSGALTHVATEWLVSTSNLFGSTVFSTTSPTNLRSITVPASTFQPGTQYYIKIAFKGPDGVASPYSEIASFTTATSTVDINTPTMTSPGSGVSLDCKAFALTTSAFSPVNANATTHTSTLWNVAKDIGFNQMVFNQDDPVYRTNITVPGNLLTPGTIYFVRFKHKSGIYASEWSQTYQVQTQAVGVTFADKGSLPIVMSGLGSLHWLQNAGAASRIGLNVFDGTADGSTVYFGCCNLSTFAWANNPVAGTALASDILNILSQEYHNKCAVINDEPYFTYITPGNAFLALWDYLLVDQTCKVYGANGDDCILLTNDVAGVVADQNVSSIALQGNSSSYLYQRAGNSLRIFSGTTLVITIQPSGAVQGCRVCFADGFGYAGFSGTDLTLNGVVVPSSPSTMSLGALDTQPSFSIATITSKINKHLNDPSISFAGNIHRFCKISNGVKVQISEATPVQGASSFIVKGSDGRYVYALAGVSAPHRMFKRCDTTAGNIDSTWAVLASLPDDCELDSKLIKYGTLLCGYGSKTINGIAYSAYFEYDTVGNTWIVDVNQSADFFFRKDAAVEVVGDFFYVHGGKNALTGSPTNQLWRRSFVLDQWSQLTSGGETVSKHVAFSKGMKLYLVGTKNYMVDCSTVGGSCVTVEDPDPVIGAPVIEVPSEGQSFQLETGQIKIQLGAFTVTPIGGDTHKRTRYQIFDNPDITNTQPLIDSDSESYLNTYYPYAGSFQAGKTYYVRAMFIGNTVSSPWSAVKSFKTTFRYNSPKIIAVGTVTDNNGLSGTIDYIQDPNAGCSVQALPLSTNPPGATTHVKTEWQLGLDGNFIDGNLLDRRVSNGGDSLTKYSIDSSKFANKYDTLIGVRVMFNDNGLWSDPVKFRTKPAKGWLTIREYRDDMQLLSAQYFLAYIRRYRAIGLRSRQLPAGDSALFVFGAEGQQNGVWNGREYPMDGSTGRVIKTDLMEYCNFVYCYGYIYRICFKHDGSVPFKIHRMLLTSNLTQELSAWEPVVTPIAVSGIVLNNLQFSDLISVFESRNKVFIYAREAALINGIPRIWMFALNATDGSVQCKYIDYPNFIIPVNGQTSYFKVDNVFSITKMNEPSSQVEKCFLTRIHPATLDPHPESKGYTTNLVSYTHNIYQLDQIQVISESTVPEPKNGWNPVYDATNDLVYYNTLSSSESITIVDPNKINLGPASAVGTTMNGIGPIPNPLNPALDPPYGKVIINHYHSDNTVRQGLYCFGGLVSGLSTNRFYLKRFT